MTDHPPEPTPAPAPSKPTEDYPPPRLGCPDKC